MKYAAFEALRHTVVRGVDGTPVVVLGHVPGAGAYRLHPDGSMDDAEDFSLAHSPQPAGVALFRRLAGVGGD